MRVPTYDQPTQQLSVESAQAYQAPQMSDAPLKQMAQGAEALGNTGKAIALIGADIEKDLNEADAKNRDVEFVKGAQAILFGDPNDPTKQGYLKSDKQAAVDGYDGARKQIEDLYDNLSSDTRSEASGQMFQRVGQARMVSILEQMGSHRAAQAKEWNKSESLARAGAFQSDAILYANNPHAYEVQMAAGVNSLLAAHPGAGIEEQKALEATYKTQTAYLAASAMDNKQSLDFFKYYADPKASDYQENLQKLENKHVYYEASDEVGTIMQGMPTGLAEPVRVQDAYDRIDKWAGDDEKKRAAGRAELSHQISVFNQERQSKITELTLKLQQMKLDGASDAQIAATPEYAALAGTRGEKMVKRAGGFDAKNYLEEQAALQKATTIEALSHAKTQEQALTVANTLPEKIRDDYIKQWQKFQTPEGQASMHATEADFKAAYKKIIGGDVDMKSDQAVTMRANIDLALRMEPPKTPTEQKAMMERLMANTILVKDPGVFRDGTITKRPLALTKSDLDKVVIPAADRAWVESGVDKVIRDRGLPVTKGSAEYLNMMRKAYVHQSYPTYNKVWK